MFSYKDILNNKHKILFITAHPDDVDVFFGGTIARLTSDNKDVRVLLVTNGARGSKEDVIDENDLALIRLEEERSALSFLGVKPDKVTTLNHKDGDIQNNMALTGDIARIVREFKPDLVATHEPHAYYAPSMFEDGTFFVHHRDHRVTGATTMDAVYPFARDRSFFPEQIAAGLEPHVCKSLLFTPHYSENVSVDITGVINAKQQALFAHKSQFNESTVTRILSMFKSGEEYSEKFNYINLAI